MTLLPLIERELGVRARRRGSYWLRFAVGGAGILICLPQLLFANLSGPANSIGSAVFNSLVGFAFILCCFAALLTADVIGSEKREGTLGLLLLTRVKWFDVILGKIFSSGIQGLMALGTLLPLLVVPILAGGVTGGEAFRKALALIITFFLALTVGIYSSVCQTDQLRAVRRSAGWIFLIVLVPYLAFRALITVTGGPIGHFPVIDYFMSLSPLTMLHFAEAANYSAAPTGFWISLLIVSVLSWTFLLRAGKRLGRAVREEDGQMATISSMTKSLPAPARVGPDQIRGAGQSYERSRWQFAMSRLTPVEWLFRRQRGISVILWSGSFFGFIFIFLFRWLIPMGAIRAGGGFMLIGAWIPPVLFNIASSCFFAWAASRFFVNSKRSGELELLLTTPVGARQIIDAQWKATKRALRIPMAVLLIAGTLFPMANIWWQMRRTVTPYLNSYLISSAMGIPNIILGIVALCWAGFWFGTRANGQLSAILWTVGTVKGTTYLMNISWSIFMGKISRPFGSPTGNFYYLSYLSQLFTLLYYLWIIRKSKEGLLKELNGEESGPFRWRRLFSNAGRDGTQAILKARNWRTT